MAAAAPRPAGHGALARAIVVKEKQHPNKIQFLAAQRRSCFIPFNHVHTQNNDFFFLLLPPHFSPIAFPRRHLTLLAA